MNWGESSCRDLRLRGKREEMTRYEVNGCFFCVKYMWENDTCERGLWEERDRKEGVFVFVDVGVRVRNGGKERESKYFFKRIYGFLFTTSSFSCFSLGREKEILA